MEIREMRVGEREAVGFDFGPDMGSNTENFASATVALSTGLTANGTPIIGGNNNTYVSQAFTVTTATAGSYYTVTITGTTSAGNIKKKVFLIRIVSDTAPAAANANTSLVRLDEAKAAIGKATDEDTAIIEMLIDNVSSEFDAYTGRNLATATYTNECYDGDGSRWLNLKNYPIIANLAVVEDDITLVVGNENDYLAYNTEGRLYRVDNTWYFGPKTIQVTYTAGYNCTSGTPTLPHDIKWAALRQIAYEFGRFSRKDDGLDSVTYPDGSKSMMQEGLLKSVTKVLDGYKRYTI